MNIGIRSIPLILCGLFYALLCVFSIVTGIIYMKGTRELNPVELPDAFVDRLENADRKRSFAAKMGIVTFIVGIVQGLTSWAILRGTTPVYYWAALGFTVFSICSVLFKLKGKISAFPLLKLGCYTLIFIIFLLKTTRAVYF